MLALWRSRKILSYRLLPNRFNVTLRPSIVFQDRTKNQRTPLSFNLHPLGVETKLLRDANRLGAARCEDRSFHLKIYVYPSRPNFNQVFPFE